MTRAWRTAADLERRRDLLLAAAGWHPGSVAVAAVPQAPALKVPRPRGVRRQGLIV